MFKKLIIIIFFVNLNFFTSNSLSLENKILFKVDNEIITSVDILKEIQYLKSINEEFKKASNEQALEISKKSLIKEKIKKIELLKFIDEIKLDKDMSEKIIVNYFGRLGIDSRKDFEIYFSNRNLDPGFVENKIIIEILWNQLIYAKFNNSVKIDEESIKKKIINKKKQEEFFISEILFNLDNGEKLENKYKIIKKIIDEKSFGQAAILYSSADTSNNGGEIGWVKDTAISKNIMNELNKLKIGQITRPLVIPGGFLIIKIVDKREVEREINLEEEFKIVKQRAINEQLNQFSNLYFNKIKNNFQINEL